MTQGFWRFFFATAGLSLMGAAAVGCDLLKPVIAPPPGPSEPSIAGALQLKPRAMILNVPSEDPCPCPHESTGSFEVESPPPGPSMRWSVEDPAVAVMNERGVVEARSTGLTTVVLEVQGFAKATASLQVLDRGGQANVMVQ